MKHTLQYLALAMSACMFMACSQQDDPNTRLIKSQDMPVDELMERSGVNAQIVQIPEKVLADAEDQLRRGIVAVDDIRAILIQTFNPSDLRTDARAYMAENLDANEVESILAWLNSDIGKKVSALEKAGRVNAKHQDVMESYRKLKKNKQRLELVHQLDDAMQSTASSVDMALATQRSLLTALIPGMPETKVITEDEIRAKIEEIRPKMLPKYKRMVEASSLHSYQSLTDGEMQAYIAFSKSEAAQHYYQVMSKSLQAAIVAAGGKAGTAIGDLGKS
ncbi:hypothetical protein [Teredinibacter purpureus]|uniref:DUF2059 domain-containing protein n=1 Tax=Teredinibacter purpureus TaxID=2731756 RepID=A0A0D3MF64_9GAMM|nr:hypothetical protein [Teredinibacter purpureus]AIH07676.1 hypothetical protein [Teredinibacter purpureus]